MEKKIKVTNIEIETESGAKVSLSLKEGKELFLQLEELFGSRQNIYNPIIIERPHAWPQPFQPYCVNVSRTGGIVNLNATCQVRGFSGLSVTYSNQSNQS